MTADAAGSDPSFPPLLRGVAVGADVDVFTAACAGARSGRHGAGDLVWSRQDAMARIALVLEPEVDRGRCLQMLPVMMVAAGDCLGALLPPQVPVQYRWPNRLLLNGGDAGGFGIALAPCPADDVPDWLVVGFDVSVSPVDAQREPGERADITSVAEEGGGDLTACGIVQSVAGHLMTWLNIWLDDGLRPVHDALMGRFEGAGGVAGWRHGGQTIEGRALGLDESGGLIVQPLAGGALTLALDEAFDLDTGCVR